MLQPLENNMVDDGGEFICDISNTGLDETSADAGLNWACWRYRSQRTDGQKNVYIQVKFHVSFTIRKQLTLH